ncbi:hypothetical protein [Fulvivirga ligni]|uniref:hypothetical protein n=1 Tax=Fulvivirga ligni TaxID=2904246 RepID=UPI001F160496|nr:hypothetical protein [Fulvivirga ligni]UII24248.1 hypothetical protein LVD16_13585 [Fulvivirga ligni]
MKTKLTLLICAMAVLFSCNEEEIEKSVYSNESFSIELPSNWEFSELQGYDSYVGEFKISNSQTIGMDLGLYSYDLPVDEQTHDISYKLIDSREAKIVHPKNFEDGTTGVYFADLDGQGTRLELSGSNLSESNQRLFLKAIETIEFK